MEREHRDVGKRARMTEDTAEEQRNGAPVRGYRLLEHQHVSGGADLERKRGSLLQEAIRNSTGHLENYIRIQQSGVGATPAYAHKGRVLQAEIDDMKRVR
eukprot:CAMPEP_0113953984 /NCGR_PEP_ID=MMETSP0011_2-20120614/173_1 /TAXON_ID=101924 /ORGANISM="Rhodosorus marinus" /LENGTH=99 /DNA_ID=CAMNT_0000962807 /DNA_START=334 /DNA_END=634 /DNA_ORIENTATION=+ /assembly_acc=CAM_ASM_000156